MMSNVTPFRILVLFSTYVIVCILFISASSLEHHRVSVQLQLDQLLYHVKERFSEVLLPVETVTKLEMFGKGSYTYICINPSLQKN